MKIGLFFGSFNPVHTGHLIIANHFIEFTDIEEIWFVVSPQNPLKNSKDLIDADLRLKLVKMATKMNSKFKACAVEFDLPKPSYTIFTLHHLQKKFAVHEFVILMGADSFTGIEKWKNHKDIIENFPIYIYKRRGYELSFSKNTHVRQFDFPLLDISATYVRQLLFQKKSVQFLVPQNVFKILQREFH